MTHQVDTVVAADLELLLDTVVAALEHDRNWAGAGSGHWPLRAGGTGSPRAARRGGGLRAGCSRAELLLDAAGRSGRTVAVVPAVHGATDAVRAPVRALAAHREIAAVAVASPPPRPGRWPAASPASRSVSRWAGWRLNRRDQTPPVEFPGGKVEVDESAAQRTSPGAWPSAGAGAAAGPTATGVRRSLLSSTRCGGPPTTSPAATDAAEEPAAGV